MESYYFVGGAIVPYLDWPNEEGCCSAVRDSLAPSLTSARCETVSHGSARVSGSLALSPKAKSPTIHRSSSGVTYSQKFSIIAASIAPADWNDRLLKRTTFSWPKCVSAVYQFVIGKTHKVVRASRRVIFVVTRYVELLRARQKLHLSKSEQ